MFRFHLFIRIIKILSLVISILLSYWLANIFLFFASTTTIENKLKKLHQKNATKIRKTAVELKGVLIKIGQFMSSRVDILPDEYTQELSQLQDRIPPADETRIRERLHKELGGKAEDIFASFASKPMAAASLGQVHEAYLKSGEHVAVKIQYPCIEQIVQNDLRAIRIACAILSFEFRKIRFDILFKEFSRLIQDELNYIHEGKNAEKFHAMQQDNPHIISPKIYWSYTTSRVLTMSYTSGIKISDVDELIKNGVNLKELSTFLTESYLRQILIHRFFHGDPHPGNLFVQNGPEGLKLVFVDFGLMQFITKDLHRGIKKTMFSIVEDDIDGIVSGLVDLGIVTWRKDLGDIREVVEFFMERYKDMPPSELKNITIDEIAVDLSHIFKIHHSLQVPNHFILFGRAAGLLNGISSSLNPDSNLIELAKPFAIEFILKEKPFMEKLDEAKSNMVKMFYNIPDELYRFLIKANRGELQTEMTSEDVTGVLDMLYRLLKTTLTLVAIFCFLLLYIKLKQKGYFLESQATAAAAIILFFVFTAGLISNR